MQKIKELATEFRAAIVRAKNDRRFTADQNYRNFPSRCCGITSELLARFLMDNGIRGELAYICGTYRDFSQELPSHAWLELEENIVIDITGDQFKYCESPLYFDETVYVGAYNDFYNIFDIDEKEICNNYYPLNDLYVRNYLSRKKLYEIILEYIDK